MIESVRTQLILNDDRQFALSEESLEESNEDSVADPHRSWRLIIFISVCLLLTTVSVSAQVTTSGAGGMMSPSFAPTTNFAPGTSTNYLKNSAAFRQEIMRMEINVVRGAQSLPITQVPRVAKGDVIKMKLLDEAVGGIRPSDSYWDWTFLVAFVNPNRRKVEKGGDKQNAVSQEIRFRQSGWYKQYSFEVPYDSQPVFFLYPKPKYREKVLKVVSRNYDEVRKLGDKTIEIAGAYAQIGSFLNELQGVLYQSQSSRYQNGATGYGSPYGSSNPYGSSGSYGSVYGATNPYGTTYNPYNPANPYGTTITPQRPDIPFNYNLFIERSIERLASSFNIAMPSCWSGNGSMGGNYGSTYGSGSTYGLGANSANNYGSYYGGYGTNNQNNFGYAVNQELISRAQCVAKNIRLEDFDFSVASMLQQGGIMLAVQLRDKYPQLAYWINLAAAAIDFIVKVFQKAALKIVPTIVQTSEGGTTNGMGGGQQLSYAMQNGMISPYSPTAPKSPMSSGSPSTTAGATVKIALYAESQPETNGFVTAYPIVVHKWQAEPDPEVISIPPPVLAEPCLHAGVNLLKNTAIGEEPEADTFTKDFKLTMSSPNGFKKEFPLRKNIGLGGWELNLTKEDLNSFPKIQMTLDSQISGTRGFSEIKSPAFVLPLSLGGSYQVAPESQKAFAVGGKRVVSIVNPLGGCQCLQAVVYKPSFGGQFVFEANSKDRSSGLQYSPDGREVSFEIDATNFQPGAGQLTLLIYGGEQSTLNLKLYALPPNITGVRMARGDNQAVIGGDRLEQLKSVKINGKRATVVADPKQTSAGSMSTQTLSQPAFGGLSNGSPNAIPNSNPGLSTVNQSPFPNQPNPLPSSGINQPATSPNQWNAGSGGNGNQNAPLSQLPATTAAQALNNVNTFTPAAPLAVNERLVVFDDPNARLTEGSIQLELGLEDDRSFQITRTFPAAQSRPAIIVGVEREIEAQIANAEKMPQTSGFDLQSLKGSVLPIEISDISVSVRNALTDYDFKIENLTLETRLEKSSANLVAGVSYGSSASGSNTGAGENLQATIDVLDWKNLRINFTFNEQLRRLLGGRRIQFRLRDRERGDSDWYTVKQTFVRIPQIESVVCTSAMNEQCELKGLGIDYISQVSVDGGATWYPGGASTLQASAGENGRKMALIPSYTNKKLLLIKLRDYPQAAGLAVDGYTFSNSVKSVKSIAKNPTGNFEKAKTAEKVEPSVPKPTPVKTPIAPVKSSVPPEQAVKTVDNYPAMSSFPGMPGYIAPKAKVSPSPIPTKSQSKQKP